MSNVHAPHDGGAARATGSRSPSPRHGGSSHSNVNASSPTPTLQLPRRALSAPPEPSPTPRQRTGAEAAAAARRASRISESTLRLFESSWFNIGMAISYLYRFRADSETQAVSVLSSHTQARFFLLHVVVGQNRVCVPSWVPLPDHAHIPSLLIHRIFRPANTWMLHRSVLCVICFARKVSCLTLSILSLSLHLSICGAASFSTSVIG